MPSDDLLEIKQYVEVQIRLANSELCSEVICTPTFLQNIHKSFYDDLPEKFLAIENPESGEIIRLTPGEFRNRDVKVGRHIPPEPEEVIRLLGWFERIYHPKKIHGIERILQLQPLIID